MWGIIKKAINSTLGTKHFQSLDSLIDSVINNTDTPLNELYCRDAKLTTGPYCVIDSVTVEPGTTVESPKRLFVHAAGTVSFSYDVLQDDSIVFMVDKNGERINPSTKIEVNPHDYFDFKIKNNHSKPGENEVSKTVTTTIYMIVEGEVTK